MVGIFDLIPLLMLASGRNAARKESQVNDLMPQTNPSEYDMVARKRQKQIN
jgi:hypothetical protein